jgi:choline kinase
VLGIILGGGIGTRLYSLMKKRAKPAVPLGANYKLAETGRLAKRLAETGNEDELQMVGRHVRGWWAAEDVGLVGVASGF